MYRYCPPIIKFVFMNKMILKEKTSLCIQIICVGSDMAQFMLVIGLPSYFVLLRFVSTKIR